MKDEYLAKSCEHLALYPLPNGHLITDCKYKTIISARLRKNYDFVIKPLLSEHLGR